MVTTWWYFTNPDDVRRRPPILKSKNNPRRSPRHARCSRRGTRSSAHCNMAGWPKILLSFSWFWYHDYHVTIPAGRCSTRVWTLQRLKWYTIEIHMTCRGTYFHNFLHLVYSFQKNGLNYTPYPMALPSFSRIFMAFLGHAAYPLATDSWISWCWGAWKSRWWRFRVTTPRCARRWGALAASWLLGKPQDGSV